MKNTITPESLFESVSQDNEVIREFKYHSLRVMIFSSLLSKKVGHYQEDLRIAALLHDIGKMGLSKQILFKQGKLTSLEKTIIESHSHVGNTIIRKEINNPRAAQFVRDHHENWDGSGYPRGLSGEEITIEGRIIRICDSFDAMTYDKRNYNLKTIPFTEAFNELRRCAWKQFDGELVEAFVSLLVELPTSSYKVFERELLDNIYANNYDIHDFS